MGLFGFGNKKKDMLVFLNQRFQSILSTLDEYASQWKPAFMNNPELADGMGELSSNALECIKNAKHWLSSMTITLESEKYIKMLEIGMRDLTDGYYKPHGSSLVISGAQKVWSAASDWVRD